MIISPDDGGIQLFHDDIDDASYLADRMEFADEEDEEPDELPHKVPQVAANDMPVRIVLENPAQAPAKNDSLFTSSRLYAVAKPIITSLQQQISGIVGSGENCIMWGTNRKRQFLDHVFSRARTVFGVNKLELNAQLDTQMVDRAATYLSALQTRNGTNFKDNDYIRLHVLEALMPSNGTSNRALAIRLGVSREILPAIISKRIQFDQITSAASDVAPSNNINSDTILEETASNFFGNCTAEQLGILYLFSNLGLDQNNDFFYEESDPAPAAPKLKDSMVVNPFHEHLKMKKRKRRKDCPLYIEVVRSYGHSVFRPDTFAKNKKMVKNEDGTYEYHMFHIQNRSIKDTHKSSIQSVIYHDWRYINRWTKTNDDGSIEVILLTICLRLFYYALCPCCKEPTQRDRADSMVVGFSHALVGMGKIRMSEINNRKHTIRTCECEYHSREVNKESWRSTEDFMSAMLCSPIEFDEFQNPEISQYTTKVRYHYDYSIFCFPFSSCHST